MGAEARAFWLSAPGRGEIRPVVLPEPGPDDVLVRTLRSGVSRGTETLVFRGGVPAGQYAAMRAPFQEGEFPAPVKYGYLNVGAVEHGPPELCGRTVFCLFPHQTAYVVPASAVATVPKGVPAARAVLAGTVETAVNALWDDFSVRDGAARLWPQTEHLKAAVVLGDEAQALRAARGLAQYLDVPARGVWRDKLKADGSFVDEPAPATSFYHLMVAIQALTGV